MRWRKRSPAKATFCCHSYQSASLTLYMRPCYMRSSSVGDGYDCAEFSLARMPVSSPIFSSLSSPLKCRTMKTPILYANVICDYQEKEVTCEVSVQVTGHSLSVKTSSYMWQILQHSRATMTNLYPLVELIEPAVHKYCTDHQCGITVSH